MIFFFTDFVYIFSSFVLSVIKSGIRRFQFIRSVGNGTYNEVSEFL